MDHKNTPLKNFILAREINLTQTEILDDLTYPAADGHDRYASRPERPAGKAS